jgi:hypothetical protein
MKSWTNWSTNYYWECGKLVARTEVRFAGYDCVKLENEALAVWITRSVGPRIIGLALQGGENLMAVLPNDRVECPGVGTFSYRGGHRLWIAPEDPHRTYLPDDNSMDITGVENGVFVEQPVELMTGIQKALTITLPGAKARVVVDHTLYNRGVAPVELAPWAITQIKPGGIGILPQAIGPVDEYGLLQNRHIALWSYTQIASPYIIWGDRYIFIKAGMRDGALKIGFPNPAGWLAYVVDETLFVKYARYHPQSAYFDRESSSECYCNPRFLELETLGPRTTLSPGESITHREMWALFAGVSLQANELAVEQLVNKLGLKEGILS